MPGEHSSGSAHSERIVPFTTADGVSCNVINVRGAVAPAKPPVLLVHGAGVRANIYRAPSGRTLVDALIDAGHDVWLENWRASIDIPHNRWTLDQAAVFDHPAAVKTVLRETRTDELNAVIHCQGSTSFMMSAVAGLIPEVKTVVSNAVSLHPVVSRLAKLKLRWTVPKAARVLGYLNPQWRLTDAPWIVPKALTAWVKLTHHECDSDVCKLVSYTYGAGKPTLWRHENLNAATHDWLRHEFADVPLTFFEQILRCVQAGHLVSVEGRPELPLDFTAQPPQTDARFVFVAGERNACFLPASQQRTFTWFERHAPGRHALHILSGYGHLDVFMGKDAAVQVFPTIIDELER
jgi:pimeloyl-ACP methyl ester carboxylesterase